MSNGKELIKDYVSYMNRVKIFIKKVLHVKLNELSRKTMPLIDDDEQQENEITAIFLLGKATQCGHKQIYKT